MNTQSSIHTTGDGYMGAWLKYPPKGPMYNVQMLWNYDVCVSRKSTGTVEVEFRSKTEPSWPSGSTAWFDIQPEVAQWLGLALLRASLQAESVQKAEVRAEFFKIMSAVKPPKDG